MKSENIDKAARELTEWFGYAWKGLSDKGRISDRGFEPWAFNGTGSKIFQGTKQDARDIVIKIVKRVL